MHAAEGEHACAAVYEGMLSALNVLCHNLLQPTAALQSAASYNLFVCLCASLVMYLPVWCRMSAAGLLLLLYCLNQSLECQGPHMLQKLALYFCM
jgi:hypothetical protein